ncbi:MAG TPA: FAD-binding oxidoreductase [Gammaproteobacteria bacterium]
MSLKNLEGWGRYPAIRGDERLSEDLEAASRNVVLTRGLGRSYGDASLPPEGGYTVLGTRLGDRILAFDETSGVLRAEAGLTLMQLNEVFIRRGWASPVSPGTQYVTLGGMVASDVHGKNHHVAGTFGEHVLALRMRLADGRVLEITDQNESELFRATIGGMGLTGHILEVEVRLERIPSSWIWSESRRVGNLDELVSVLRCASREWPFTMSWVDCLAKGSSMGRGIVIVGRWATPEEAPPDPPKARRRVGVPFDLPSWVLGSWSIRAFNFLYFHMHGGRERRGIVHPQSFFYPLDMIRDWNRLYGRRGFTQYQCVLPADDRGIAYRKLFDLLSRRGGASFLSVVKDCGKEGRGIMSFPMPGISVALDLAMREGRTQKLIDEMNEVVIEAGGRIYLTKDALTRPDHLRAMEPRLAAWSEVRHKWDPSGRLRSALADRLLRDLA